MRLRTAFPLTLLLSVTALSDEIARNFRTAVPAGGVEHVEVRISVGEVEIRTGPTKQIEVTGSIRRDYDDDSSRDRGRAEEMVKDHHVEVVVRGDHAVIREKRGRSARSRFVDSELDVRITVPAGVNLQVEQSIGELDIAGNFRDVEVDMRVGELTVRLPKANVKELSAGARVGEVHADLGDREMRREGLFAGDAHFVSGRGTATVDLHLTVGEIDVRLE